MKIQPIDAIRTDQAKPVVRSRLKRLFDRNFSRTSSSEKIAGDAKERDREVAFGGDLEPSSIALDKMVRNFMEDSNEKYGRSHRCNCFHGNGDDSSDDDIDFTGDAPIISSANALQGLVLCASVTERNLAADAASIIDKIKSSKSKQESRTILTDGLRSLGHDAAICKSRWEKSPSHPAGEHEYVDVIIDGRRILIDVDFRSEFEIARPTKSYRALLQSLPLVFVGTADRVAQIVAVVSEAAKQSLKKRGMPLPPWRKAGYVRAKWLSPFERDTRGEIKAVDLDGAEGDEASTEQDEEVTSKTPEKVVTGFAEKP